MSIRIVVPELSESVMEATVVRWLKQEGDQVAVGEPVVELETEKVNLEVGAERAGVLARIERQEGEDVKVGDVLGVIEEKAAEVAQRTAAEREEAPERAPEVSEEREEQVVETGETMEAEQQETPTVEEEEETLEEREKEQVTPTAPPRVAVEEQITPSARRLAREHDIDLTHIPSKTPSGRITKEDIQAYLEKQKGEPKEAAPVVPTPAPGRREERIRMSRRRRTIARRLVEAQRTAAMLTTYNEVDMGPVLEIRKRRREPFQKRYGVNLGIVSFFVKATIGALKVFPELNAEIQDEEIVLKHYYDIGVAIGAAEGLVVPMIRDADRLSFAEIEQAIKEFAQKAHEGTLSLEDLRGGTFTITNGGVFGSLLSTPILNPPQVGILGLHKIEERPIVHNSAVIVRSMMYVALSYDHRIVDGREAVQFLVRIKELIEDPETLLLEG